MWVRPPALTIATSKSRCWSRSMSAPSWFDWKKSTPSPSPAARSAHPGVDLVERRPAVDLRLARAQQVEVRSLEDEDARHRRPASAAGRGEVRAAEQRRDRAVDDRSGHVGPDDHAVGRRQDPAQPPAGMLLVGAEVLADERRADRAAGRDPSSSRSRRPSIRAARAGGVTPSSSPIRQAARSP